MNTRALCSLWLSIALLALPGCGDDDAEAVGAQPSGAQPASSNEPVLVGADAPAPAGVALTATEPAPWAGVATPSGDDWSSDRMAHGLSFGREDGVAVMLQRQNGVPAEARTEYADSFVEVNQRDASGYAVTERTNGRVVQAPSTRVDGTFDNGTPMTTRDYLVFVNGGVSSIMVRGPATEQALVRGLADHIAASVAR